MRALIQQLNRGTIRFLSLKENRWIFIVLLLFLVGMYAQAIVRYVVYDKSDFNVFMVPAIGARFHGENPIETYTINSYNAFFYVVLSLLAPFTKWMAITIWTTINLLLYFWIIGISYALINNGNLPQFSKKLLVGPFLFVFPFFDNIQLGQSNIMMLFAIIVGVYYLVFNKTVKSAIAFGFAIAFKTTPAFFLLFIGMKKRILNGFLTVAFAMIFMIGVPMLFYSPQKSIEFFTSWTENVLFPFASGEELKTINTGIHHSNQSMDAFLGRHFTDYGCEEYGSIHCSINPSFFTTDQVKTFSRIIKLLLIALVALLFFAKGPPSPYRTIYQASVCLIAILFISPSSWLNHYIIVLPAVLVAVNEIQQKAKGSKGLLYSLVFMIVLICLSVDPFLQSLSLYFIGTFVFLLVYVYHYFRHFDTVHADSMSPSH